MLSRCIAVFLVAIIVAGLACAVAFAAEDNSPVSLELKDADVRSAIDSLFRGRNRNYSVSQDVAGVIPSLSITGVPFDQALKSLLKPAGLVYRVENSVYMISRKPETSAIASVDTSAVAVATDSSTVDTTTTVESIIDKVPLSNLGASQILSIMEGNKDNNNNYGGGMGMMGGGYGGSSYGGYGGGSSYGGGSYGGSSYGGYGGSSYGGRSSSYGGYSGYGGRSNSYGSSGGYGRSW